MTPDEAFEKWLDKGFMELSYKEWCEKWGISLADARWLFCSGFSEGQLDGLRFKVK